MTSGQPSNVNGSENDQLDPYVAEAAAVEAAAKEAAAKEAAAKEAAAAAAEREQERINRLNSAVEKLNKAVKDGTALTKELICNVFKSLKFDFEIVLDIDEPDAAIVPFASLAEARDTASTDAAFKNDHAVAQTAVIKLLKSRTFTGSVMDEVGKLFPENQRVLASRVLMTPVKWADTDLEKKYLTLGNLYHQGRLYIDFLELEVKERSEVQHLLTPKVTKFSNWRKKEQNFVKGFIAILPLLLLKGPHLTASQLEKKNLSWILAKEDPVLQYFVLPLLAYAKDIFGGEFDWEHAKIFNASSFLERQKEMARKDGVYSSAYLRDFNAHNITVNGTADANFSRGLLLGFHRLLRAVSGWYCENTDKLLFHKVTGAPRHWEEVFFCLEGEFNEFYDEETLQVRTEECTIHVPHLSKQRDDFDLESIDSENSERREHRNRKRNATNSPPKNPYTEHSD